MNEGGDTSDEERPRFKRLLWVFLHFILMGDDALRCQLFDLCLTVVIPAYIEHMSVLQSHTRE